MADWSETVKLDPRQANNYLGRAQTAHALKKYPEAVADCTEALRLAKPEQAGQALQARGAAHKEAGDLDAAVADFTEAMKRDPKDTFALVSRGHAWLGKKDE